VPVRKDKWVTARIPHTTKKIEFAHISVCSGLKYHAEYVKLDYPWAASTVLGKIPGHIPPRDNDGGSDISLRRKEITSEFSIGCTQADWKMITAHNN
jgi:hypothetical protein